MQDAYDSFDFSHAGREFRAYLVADDSGETPWDRECGHGPVRKAWFKHTAHTSDKRPGERPLNFPDRNLYQYYYDWQAACKLARADGWNTEPYDAPNRVERAVQADFDRLRRFIAGGWCYVGVCVCLLDDDGEPIGEPYDYALWGIESDCKDFIHEVAEERAAEILADISKREALLDLHMKGL